MDDLVGEFVAETREGLEALDSELVRFEQNPNDPATLGGVFRLIHTIKGTCGFLGLGRLQRIAHAAENVLGAFRDETLAVTPVAVSAVLDAVDLIRTLTDALATTGVEPAGDDSALVARLEAVLRVTPNKDEAPNSAPSTGHLIDRLGGDATIDAAVEMALARLSKEPAVKAALCAADADAAQGALRESLCRLARGQEGGEFEAALADALSLSRPSRAAGAAFDAIAAALQNLDVEPEVVAQLRRLALPEQPAQSMPAEDEAPARPSAETEAIAASAPASKAAVSPPALEAGSGQTIRVSVDALEHLMTVVSELVLIRNQLIQALRLEPESAFAAPLHRLNQVTSELQERVMTTRMQPISGAWAKLPRLVRDLAQELGKSIDLVMIGQETELDRQVLELIKDPLTHMIRNAADHGLETPAERRAQGKPPNGRVTLHARHEGGAILIEVADDGRGLAADKIRAKAISSGLVTAPQAEQMSDAEARQLIFLPGFSTASHITAVSGRGVGMDVVRTNIEKIGGTIEVSSAEGAGTRFMIRIPLTLTIVSALIVECCGERFAIPQASVVELVSASGASGRSIEHLNGAAVLRLRDGMLPLVPLQALLGLEPANEPPGESCIVVSRVGAFTFGVIVDRVFDIEEIVVKPVASILRHIRLYSGATILGDGSVILILDPKGMSLEAGAGQAAAITQEEEQSAPADSAQADRGALLVFRAANETLKAARLSAVARIEEVSSPELERVDGRTVIQYRGRLMPVMTADASWATTWEGGGRRPLLVFSGDDGSVGLLVDEIVDIVEASLRSEFGSNGAGASGSLIIAGQAAELIDVGFYWRKALHREEMEPEVGSRSVGAGSLLKRLLVVDSSPFSQLLLRPLLRQAGYDVTVAADARAALALHDSGERYHLIMADARPEAPELAGLVKAFGQAKAWHQTPLLGLAMHSLGAASGFDGATVLDAVSNAIDDERGAA